MYKIVATKQSVVALKVVTGFVPAMNWVGEGGDHYKVAIDL